MSYQRVAMEKMNQMQTNDGEDEDGGDEPEKMEKTRWRLFFDFRLISIR